MNAPLLSILIPSRKRAPLLAFTIANLQSILGPHIEICVKLDIDDLESIETIKPLISKNLKLIISDKKNGYRSLGMFFGELLEIATGEHLMFWSDDAYLIKKGNLLEMLSTPRPIPNLFFNYKTDQFPVIHKEYISLLAEKWQGRKNVFTALVPIDGYFRDVQENLYNFAPDSFPWNFTTQEVKHTYPGPEVHAIIHGIGYDKGWKEVDTIKYQARVEHFPELGHPLYRIQYDWRYFASKLLNLKEPLVVPGHYIDQELSKRYSL